MLVIEYMPRCWRATHEAAGYRGLAGCGRYPHNGAVRVRLESMTEVDFDEVEGTMGQWARTIDVPDEE